MKNLPKYRIHSLGENAITISFGNEMSVSTSELVLQLAAAIESDPFAGFIECVPAYSSLSVFYDLLKARKNFRCSLTSFEIVKAKLEMKLQNLEIKKPKASKPVEIPVSFEKKFALDLKRIAETKGLKCEDVVEIFLAKTYRVFMLGFLPGFAYMGEVDERIAVPRKAAPRTSVAKGSVGIAGKQTGIYPLESPGGWQIIGKTDIELFTPDKASPSFLSPGDFIKFVRLK